MVAGMVVMKSRSVRTRLMSAPPYGVDGSVVRSTRELFEGDHAVGASAGGGVGGRDGVEAQPGAL